MTLVTGTALQRMIAATNKPPRLDSIMGDPYISTREVGVVIGGGGDPLSQYEAAKALCALAGKTQLEIIACNDMIALFPDELHNAVTLHPDKMPSWLRLRQEHGFNDPPRLWAHRSYRGFTHHTRDWQGSSGLISTKIAREIGLTHIILCGVPMTVEDDHFVRHQRWNAAHGFRRGWVRHIPTLKPFVRSMSGWTLEQFGEPTIAWLQENIPDLRPMRPEPEHIKA